MELKEKNIDSEIEAVKKKITKLKKGIPSLTIKGLIIAFIFPLISRKPLFPNMEYYKVVIICGIFVGILLVFIYFYSSNVFNKELKNLELKKERNKTLN